MATPEEARRALAEQEARNAEFARDLLQEREPDTVLRDVEEVVGSFGAGANRGIANVLGLPVDAVNFLLRMGGVPVSDTPFLGSESIRSGMSAIGLISNFEGLQEKGVEDVFVNRMGFRIGEETGAAAVPGGATLGLARRGVGTGSGIFGSIMQGARESPGAFAAMEGVAALGGGVGAGVAQEIFPDSPVAETIGQVAGGIGLATLPSAVGAGKRIAIDPFTQAGRERSAAQVVQDSARNPEGAAARLAEPDIPDVPDAVFTSAQLANDAGLLALERSVVRKGAELAGRFQEIATATNSASRQAILKATGGQTSSQAIADFLQGRVKGLIDLLDARTSNAIGAARSKIDNIRPSAAAEDSAVVVRREIESALSDARTTETALWQSIYAGRNVGQAPIREQYDRILALARKNAAPEDIPVLKNEAGENILANLDDTDTVDEVLALRSRILRAKRIENAADAPNGTLLKNLDLMQEASLRALGLLEGQATTQGGQQIRAALDFSRQLNDTFTRGPLGKVLGFDTRGGRRVPDIETLDKLVRPGFSGATNADAIIRALTSQVGGGDIEGGARLVEGLQNFIFDRFITSTHGASGQFDATAARRFLTRFSPALDRFPGMKSQLEEATRTGSLAEIMSRSGGRLQRTLVDARRSRAAVFLDRDVDKAISATFGAKKPSQAMGELVRQTRRDTTGEALEGLKQGVYEHMIRSVELGALDLEGVPVLSARLFRRFMQTNNRTLTSIYSPAEMGRLRQVGKALDMAERSIKSAITGGSDTAQNVNILTDAVARITGGTLGARAGALVGGSPLVAAQVLATKARQLVTLAPERAVRELVERAIFDPDIMKTLLMKPTGRNADVVFRRLQGHLLNLQLPPLAPIESGQTRPPLSDDRFPPTSGPPVEPFQRSPTDRFPPSGPLPSPKVGGIPREFFREQ